MSLTGRGRLTAICPHCHRDMGGNASEVKPICIAVAGGVNTGKSSYMMSLMNVLTDMNKPLFSLPGSLPEERDKRVLKKAVTDLSRGLPPMKTPATDITATMIDFHFSRNFGRRVFLYDPAGETFRNSADIDRHGYYDFLNGIILLIDPFSSLAVREKAESLGVDMSRLAVSKDSIESGIGVLLDRVSALPRSERVRGKWSIPCAVTINKADVEPVRSVILKKADPSRGGKAVAISSLCQSFLTDNEMGNIVRLLERNFHKIQYFAVSALGRTPDTSGRPFSPFRTEEPILWILRDCDSVFHGKGE